MKGWTIYREDGDAMCIIPAEADESIGGWRTQLLNGIYPTKLAAIEAAIDGAVEELITARSRVSKLRAMKRRVLAKAPDTSDATLSPGMNKENPVDNTGERG